MTRSDARELAVHLIYAREFTGEEPESVVATRFNKEYYSTLSQENTVYTDRPSNAQLRYIDTVVSGVANRSEELNNVIQQYSIGWDIRRTYQFSSFCSVRLLAKAPRMPFAKAPVSSPS